MKYILRNTKGETVRSGELEGHTTPRVILDSSVPAVYLQTETTSGFCYDEVPWLKLDESQTD